MNLSMEVTSPTNALDEDEEEIASALAACYLLARQRASAVRIGSDSAEQEEIQNIASEPQSDQYSQG